MGENGKQCYGSQGKEQSELDALFLVRMRKDIEAGIRNRRFRAKFRVLAARHHLDADVAWDYLGEALRNTTNPAWDGKAVAGSLGIDWEGLTDFMEALAPIILTFMEASGT